MRVLAVTLYFSPCLIRSSMRDENYVNDDDWTKTRATWRMAIIIIAACVGIFGGATSLNVLLDASEGGRLDADALVRGAACLIGAILTIVLCVVGYFRQNRLDAQSRRRRLGHVWAGFALTTVGLLATAMSYLLAGPAKLYYIFTGAIGMGIVIAIHAVAADENQSG